MKMAVSRKLGELGRMSIRRINSQGQHFETNKLPPLPLKKELL